MARWTGADEPARPDKAPWPVGATAGLVMVAACCVALGAVLYQVAGPRDVVDEIIRWLTGYSQRQLEEVIEKRTDFEHFFAEAPALNPSRKLITGTICGVRIAEIDDPLMLEVRYLDKLVDELARGKAMAKILRE